MPGEMGIGNERGVVGGGFCWCTRAVGICVVSRTRGRDGRISTADVVVERVVGVGGMAALFDERRAEETAVGGCCTDVGGLAREGALAREHRRGRERGRDELGRGHGRRRRGWGSVGGPLECRILVVVRPRRSSSTFDVVGRRLGPSPLDIGGRWTSGSFVRWTSLPIGRCR